MGKMSDEKTGKSIQRNKKRIRSLRKYKSRRRRILS
jgi:hypothetical protein